MKEDILNRLNELTEKIEKMPPEEVRKLLDEAINKHPEIMTMPDLNLARE